MAAGAKIIITKYNDLVVSMLIDADGKTARMSVTDPEKKSRIGNVYAANIKNVVKGIGGAFAQIAGDEMGFVKPKKNTEPVFLNIMRSPGPLRQGDIILAQVSADAQKMKEVSLTWDVKLSEEILSQVIKLGKEKKKGLLYESPEEYIKDLEYIDRYDVKEIVTDDTECFLKVKAYLQDFMSEKTELLRAYNDTRVPFRTVYAIEKRIDEATLKKVNLKSGAFLVIEPTEAMVVIDVNSGKAISGRKDDKQFLKINLEAAAECARQIALRNLSGIIMIDFINMESKEDEKVLISEMKKLLKSEGASGNVIDMTGLGIMEITRKKVRRPLYEIMYI